MSLYSKEKWGYVEGVGYWKERITFGAVDISYLTVFISDCKDIDKNETIITYPRKENNLSNTRNTLGHIIVTKDGAAVV